MNMPYQQPIMNNPYMQPQNPYIDRMNFLQNYQQSLQQPMAGAQMPLANQQPMHPQPTGINGRIVQALENVNANEVPMDGSMAFFPKQDMSEIYVKSWNADGTIKTTVYKPYTEPKINQEVNSTTNAENFEIRLSEKATEDIMDKFNELFDKIEELEAKMQRKSSRTQSKESE